MRAFDQRKKDSPAKTSFFGPKIQKKLKTGTAGDQFEVEADRVADKIVNNNSSGGGLLQSKDEVQQKPISETISSVQAKDIKEEEPVQKKSDKKEEDKKVQKKAEKKEEEKPIQAKCAECEKEDKVQKKDKKDEEKKVQKKEQNSEAEVQDNELEGKLDNSKGSGTGMDKKTKKEMESGFGNDFSNVKIHTDANAVQMSQELGAQAFTNGNDVYFNEGKYNPDSREGKHLLAHELTHTVQQTRMVQKSVVEDHPENLQNPAEPHFKGNPPLEKANDNEMLIASGHKGGYVSEIQTGLLEWNKNSLPNFGADGDFGSETKNAVLDFQIDRGLYGKDGIVGPETMGALDNFVTGKGGKKKPPKKCPRTKPVIVKKGKFSGLMRAPFFAEIGCNNTIIIKSTNLRDNSEVGGCSAFDVVIDGILRETVNPPFGKEITTTIKQPGISEGRHEMTLSVSPGCFATVQATVSVF